MPRHSHGAVFVLGRALRRAVSGWRPDQVVPLDDLAATLLRHLASDARMPDDVTAVLRASFGDPAGYGPACQRVGLMRVAAAHGVRAPRFAAAEGFAGGKRAALDLGFPMMVKRDQSSGSGGVVRVTTPAQLVAATRSAYLKTCAKAMLGRLAGVAWPSTPTLLQQAVEGRLAMFTAVCRAGRLIDGIGFEAIATHPTKRSSTILQPCAAAEMAEAARRIVAALGCSGFVSFDFILDADERAFLIEMNPRPIGSAHLGRLFGHDLAEAFLTGDASGARATAATAVALFPKELERDPTGDRIRADPTILHDVPRDEPAVMAAYARHLGAEHPAYASTFDAWLRDPAPPSSIAGQSLAA